MIVPFSFLVLCTATLGMYLMNNVNGAFLNNNVLCILFKEDMKINTVSAMNTNNPVPRLEEGVSANMFVKNQKIQNFIIMQGYQPRTYNQEGA